MSAKLTEGTLVRHPETGDLVSLLAGGEIPAWAESLVGDHLKSESPDESETPDESDTPDESETPGESETPAKRTTRAAK